MGDYIRRPPVNNTFIKHHMLLLIFQDTNGVIYWFNIDRWNGTDRWIYLLCLWALLRYICCKFEKNIRAFSDVLVSLFCNNVIIGYTHPVRLLQCYSGNPATSPIPVMHTRRTSVSPASGMIGDITKTNQILTKQLNRERQAYVYRRRVCIAQ